MSRVFLQKLVDASKHKAVPGNHAPLEPPKNRLRVHPQRMGQSLIAEDLAPLDLLEFGDSVPYHIMGDYQMI